MKTIQSVIAIAAVALVAGVAQAKDGDGYWQAPPANATWKNTPGECWRTGYWTPANATAQCDAHLMKKPAAAPAPRAAPAPAPKAAPAPAPKPAEKPKTLSITSTELFAFNSSSLSDAAKSKLDKDVVGRLGEFATISFINIYGHTDRLGSAQYNQKLSEKRADAVKAYLVSKGVDASRMETYGYGKTAQVKVCTNKNRKELIACLEPNRRVVVEIKGAPK